MLLSEALVRIYLEVQYLQTKDRTWGAVQESRSRKILDLDNCDFRTRSRQVRSLLKTNPHTYEIYLSREEYSQERYPVLYFIFKSRFHHNRQFLVPK
ncbi:unnamed protein product [Meloidogyne enterolobii]|uniref:Uncharacterized protein n=1 Tax=Meloidogyne enterolobii TaxID=390850 RepID=A0ACB0Y7S3_MELEN